MSLAVIGAGFGRTGTLSLKLALERLGYAPCYHMDEIIRHPEKIADWTTVARPSDPDWEAVFRGYRASVDWPAVTYWRELARHYPQAKVVLSVRDPDRWFESTQNTIFNPEFVAHMPPPVREMVDLTVFSVFGGRIHDRAHCIEVYERHNRAVIDSLPIDRLLVFRVGDGWEPLCTFLGCDAPPEPFPRTNDADAFRELVGKMASSPGSDASGVPG